MLTHHCQQLPQSLRSSQSLEEWLPKGVNKQSCKKKNSSRFTTNLPQQRQPMCCSSAFVSTVCSQTRIAKCCRRPAPPSAGQNRRRAAPCRSRRTTPAAEDDVTWCASTTLGAQGVSHREGRRLVRLQQATRQRAQSCALHFAVVLHFQPLVAGVGRRYRQAGAEHCSTARCVSAAAQRSRRNALAKHMSGTENVTGAMAKPAAAERTTNELRRGLVRLK